MVKEDLVKLDNTPLFPKRWTCTVNSSLSDSDSELDEQVTTYVKEQMDYISSTCDIAAPVRTLLALTSGLPGVTAPERCNQ